MSIPPPDLDLALADTNTPSTRKHEERGTHEEREDDE
jgi:hypothetical protein